jgi:hypothetical protein
MEYEGIRIAATCRVRNEINGLRKSSEIVYTKPDPGHPYYPRTFPLGIWTVKAPIATKEKYLEPFFIPTTATQKVEVWAIKDGLYDHPTGEYVTDTGYGIHFSTSGTTLGCIRVSRLADLDALVNAIKTAILKNELIELEVTE